MTEWIVVDIGNSAIKAGRFRDGRLAATCRVPVIDGTCDLEHEFAVFVAAEPIAAAAMASVVPKFTDVVADLVRDRSGIRPIRVDSGCRLPFRMGYETPKTLGADRLAAAAAAWSWRSRSRPSARVAIAVDAGTALNVEVVAATAEGPAYLGGVIAPGPELMRRAMNEGTAQLPRVDLSWPSGGIGATTVTAIQTGLLPGFVHAVDGILQRIEHELGERAVIVATGGWADLLVEQLPRLDRADPDLVLRGIREIAELNRVD